MFSLCCPHAKSCYRSSCSVQDFKNTEAYIGEMAWFFSYSAKRQQLFDKAMDTLSSPPNAKKLKDACRMRWIQRIDSYTVFLELLPALHMTLQAMTCPQLYKSLGTDWKWDTDTITKANSFLYQLVFLFLGEFQYPSWSVSKSSKFHCKAATTCNWCS